MYKLLIVDDEITIREGIANGIDWNELQISTVTMAETGEEAITSYEKLKPDLIITDIRMPGLNGLDFVHRIHSGVESQDAKIVFLSGYDDYEYVRRAMQLKAFDYLLKPIDPLELKGVVKKIVLQLKAYSSECSDALPILQRSFLEEMLQGQTKFYEDHLEIKLEQLKLGWIHCSTLYVMAVELDHYWQLTDHKEQLIQAVHAVIVETFQQHGPFPFILVPYSKKGWIVVLGIIDNTHQDYSLREYVTTLGEMMLQNVNRQTKLKISIGISQSYEKADKLHNQFRQSVDALNLKRILGGNKLFHHNPLQSDQPNKPTFNEPFFIQQLLHGNLDSVLDSLQMFHSMVSSFKLKNAHEMHSSVCEWVLHIHRILKEASFFQLSIENSLKLWEQIEECQTAEDIQSALTHHFTDVLHKKGEVSNQTIHSAIEYIYTNLHKKLSLKEVSEHVYVSPIWLSKLFRQETGITFLAYVTKLKIDAAKQLLCHCKVFEAAESIGFKDIEHFSKLFKKQTGYSPTEYKKMSSR